MEDSVQVLTSDNLLVLVPRPVAMEIPMIRLIIEDSGDDDEEIPLGIVSKLTLDKVVEFVDYFRSTPYNHPLPKPLPKGGLKECITDEWYLNFIDLPKEEVLHLVSAGNYLQLERLFELASAKIGEQIKSMSLDQIREYFGIENDFTPEEEEKIKSGKVNLYQELLLLS